MRDFVLRWVLRAAHRVVGRLEEALAIDASELLRRYPELQGQPRGIPTADRGDRLDEWEDERNWGERPL